MTESLNGRAMVAVSAGILLVWSGVKGWSVLGTLGDLVKGQQPAQTNNLPLTQPGTGSAGAAGGSAASGGFAQEALQYQGHAYNFGGAPKADGSGAWDCSSFVNFVIGVRFKLSIPGYKAGAYNGSSHGPATGQWAGWNGLTSISRADVQVNDIVVWTGHMGIAVSNTQYISAQNPENKTRVSSIDGMGKVLRAGRYVGVQ